MPFDTKRLCDLWLDELKYNDIWFCFLF